MRYMVNPGNFLEVGFNTKEEALKYAEQLFKKGEETCSGEVFWPQKNGYSKPEQLVDSIPEYLGEEDD